MFLLPIVLVIILSLETRSVGWGGNKQERPDHEVVSTRNHQMTYPQQPTGIAPDFLKIYVLVECKHIFREDAYYESRYHQCNNQERSILE
jgi:hypothetical protein